MSEWQFRLIMKTLYYILLAVLRLHAKMAPTAKVEDHEIWLRQAVSFWEQEEQGKGEPQ